MPPVRSPRHPPPEVPNPGGEDDLRGGRTAPAEVYDGPSKSQLKRDMTALQDLGKALLAADPKRLAVLDLPEALQDALKLGRKITKHEAKRRQLQYIGRLMRDIDPEPIRLAVAQWSSGPAAERARFATLERWRDRIIAEADGAAAFAATYPNADAAALARLAADARAERARQAPPRAYRALFRELERLLPVAGDPSR